MLVGNFQAQKLGFHPDYEIDRRYFDMAKTAGKLREFLETVQFQIDVLPGTPDVEWVAGIEPQLDDDGQSLLTLVAGRRRINDKRMIRIYGKALH